MQQKNSVLQLTTAAMLVAIGIIIPIISPIKIILEPASFTLASHVPIFIAMFISPAVAAAVAIGTTIGFQLAGFPIVVVLRAASHVIFVLAGAKMLENNPSLLQSPKSSLAFSGFIGLIHGICEVAVVFFFYFSNQLGATWQTQSILLLVGVGTIIHSMVDFAIAQVVWQALKKPVQRAFAS